MKKWLKCGARALGFLASTFLLFGTISCGNGDDDDSNNSNTGDGGSSSVAVTGVSLDKNIYNIVKDDNFTLTATVSPENATNKNVTWSSIDSSVAEVDDSGKVSAKAKGTTYIVVKTEDGNKTAKAKIFVFDDAASIPENVDESIAAIAGTYIIAGETYIISVDGKVKYSNGEEVGTVEVSEGSVTIKDSNGGTLYTAETTEDGFIDTSSLKDGEGETVAVIDADSLPKWDEYFYPAAFSDSALSDTDLKITFDEKPTINTSNSSLKVRIYKDGQEIDTIGSFDETYNSGYASNGAVGSIKVANELISISRADEKTILIKPHTDSNAYSLIGAGTYTVKIDRGLISGKINGVDFDSAKDDWVWQFTLTTNEPTNSTTVQVGGESANFASIQGALNYIRKKDLSGDITINVAEGNYHERLYASTEKANIKLIGATSSEGKWGDKVTVYWENNEKMGNSGARARASFLYYAKNKNLFIQHMTFINTTNRVKYNYSDVQAETLSWDASGQLIVNKCSFYSYQDTLYIGANGGRAWFYDNYIAGDVDFIWGYGDTVLVENCELVARADGIKNNAYILAPRSSTGAEANKGFVVLNCNVTIEDGCEANYGRNSGADYNGAVINSKFKKAGTNAKFNYCMWGNKLGQKDGANENFFDAAKDIAIGFKDYGNTLDGSPISTETTEAQRGGSYLMTERVVNREYNGRYAILNRGFNTTDSIYKSVTSGKEFDFGSYETEFGATTDSSKDNIYVEPVYVNNLLSPEIEGGVTKTLTVTKHDGTAATVTWSSSDENLATVANGVVTAVKSADGKVNIIATSGERKDWAVVKVIPEALVMTIKCDTDTVTQGETTDWSTSDNVKILELDLGVESKLSSNKYAAVISGGSSASANVTYETTLATIAAVAEDGTVTAKHIGNAVITVTESATNTVYKYLVHVKDSSTKSSFGLTLQEVPIVSTDPEAALDFGLFKVSSGVAANEDKYTLGNNNKYGLKIPVNGSITIPVQGPSKVIFAPDPYTTSVSEVTVSAANNTKVADIKTGGKTDIYFAKYTGTTATTLTFTWKSAAYLPAFAVIAEADTTPVDVTWDFGTEGDYAVLTNVIMHQSGTTIGILPDPQTGAYLEIDATNGKFTPRAPANDDVQVNSGTIFYVPVSNGSVATINMKAATYKVNDTVANANTTTVNATAAGFVKVELTGNTYIDGSISVTKLNRAETRVSKIFTTLVDSDVELSFENESVTLDLSASDPTSTNTLTVTGSSNYSISYESKNPSIATVDSNGKVTVAGIGTTEIVATDSTSGVSAKYSVVVKQNTATENMFFDFRGTGIVTNTSAAETFDFGILTGSAKYKDSSYGTCGATTINFNVLGASKIYFAQMDYGGDYTVTSKVDSTEAKAVGTGKVSTIGTVGNKKCTKTVLSEAITEGNVAYVTYTGSEAATITVTGNQYLSRIWVEKYEKPNVTITPTAFTTVSKDFDLSATEKTFTQTTTATASNNSTVTIKYTSTVPAVATVNETSGLVTAVGIGKTEIKAICSATDAEDAEVKYTVNVKQSSPSEIMDFDFRTNGISANVDYGVLNVSGGSYHGTRYGLQSVSGKTVTLKVKSGSTIYIGKENYADTWSIKIGDSTVENTTIDALTTGNDYCNGCPISDAISNNKVASYTYSGNGDATITLTATSTANNKGYLAFIAVRPTPAENSSIGD